MERETISTIFDFVKIIAFIVLLCSLVVYVRSSYMIRNQDPYYEPIKQNMENGECALNGLEMKLKVINGSDSWIERYYGNEGDFIEEYNYTIHCMGYQIVIINSQGD